MEQKKGIRLENNNMEDGSAKLKVPFKRQRSENWTEEDKVLLKDLVRQKVRKIENKNTDTNSNQSKKKAWSELERDFNLLASEMRTVKQLKSQWTSIKIQAKKEMSLFRTESKKTGGGEAPAGVPMSGDDIFAWLPNEFVTDENEFDSDMALVKDTQKLDAKELEADECEADELADECVEIEFLSGEEDVSQSELRNDLGTPKIVVAETSNTKKRAKIDEQKDKLIKQIASVDVECRRELHQRQIEVEDTKLRNMQEVHQRQVRNLDAEYEVIQARLNYFKNKAFDTTEV